MITTAITNTKPAFQPAFSLTNGANEMRLKANDAFHTSQTRTVQAGQEFETTSPIGRDLVARGLATVVSEEEDEPVAAEDLVVEEKAELPPVNKVEPAPANKRGPGRPPKIKAEEGE